MKSKKVKINSYFIKNKGVLFGLVSFSILSGIGESLWSFIFQELYEITERMTVPSILSLLCAVAGVFCFCMITGNVAVYFRRVLLKNMNLQLKTEVFQTIMNKNIEEFTESNSARYISLLNNDVANLENQYFQSIPMIIDRICIFIACTLVLVYYNVFIAIVVILTAFFLASIPILFGKKITERERFVYEEMENYNGKLKDLLNGFEVVKSFHATKQAGTLFEESVTKVEDAKYKVRKFQNPFSVFLLMLTYLVIIMQLLFAAYMAYIGKIPASAIMSIFYLISSINNPVKDIAEGVLTIRSALPNIQKIEMLFDEQTKKDTKDLVKNVASVMPLTIKELSFGYEKEKEILHKLNFQFEKNKKYAVVGNSGSGKSTLIKLLMKYYDTYDGNIYWGDCELRNLDKEFLCTQVAMIHQRVFLFEDTLRNNITMFQEHSEEEIQYAVECSGLREVVERHPEGLDFVIHENGNNFSGGEQQRISIARAILKKTKVLLLDEATSSLDKKMASQIEKLILSQPEMTVIVVTHKLDADILKQYDCILAMNHGNFIETGSFDELMAKREFFYSLYTVNE